MWTEPYRWRWGFFVAKNDSVKEDFLRQEVDKVSGEW
jgi:hypothetical protein